MQNLGEDRIGKLFAQLFIPTLLSLSFSAMLNIADGIFVGQGVGADGLAAINIAAPIFMVATGIALMFGSGVSVVAAVHLSQGNAKAASAKVTQAFMVALSLLLVVGATTVSMPDKLCYLFGGTERLLPQVRDYLVYVTPSLIGFSIVMIGMFVIRLDGSPNYAMMSNVVPSVLNIILDYVFVFPLGMGIKGAALATSVSEWIGVGMIAYYMAFRSRQIHIDRRELTTRSARHVLRDITYMARVGMPTFIGETAMSGMMITGNYMFVRMLGEEGVAAFSVACYLMPVIFMFGNAISQAALPILSYNHGRENTERVRRTMNLSLAAGVTCGTAVSIAGAALSGLVSAVFLEAGTRPYDIAIEGLPLYSTGFIFFTLNLVIIGYYQSIEQNARATTYMLLRGYILVIPLFIMLPQVMGASGLWLAVPTSEFLTTVIIGVCRAKNIFIKKIRP